MTECTQMFMMFCITFIAIVGIISVLICYSKYPFSFMIKAHKKNSAKKDADLKIMVHRKTK